MVIDMSWYTDTIEKLNTYCNSKLGWYKKEHKFTREMHRQSFVQVESVQSVNPVESDDDQTIHYFKHYTRLLELEVEAADKFGADNPATTVHLSTQTKSFVEKLKRAYEEKNRLFIASPNNAELELVFMKYAAAYHAAEILLQIKEFELAAYKYRNGNKTPLRLLAELNAYITTHKQFLYMNRFTGNVLTKLIQVQSRMNEQFGNKEYDKERAKNGFTAIINNLTTAMNDIHANDKVSKDRLGHIQTFTSRLQNEDIQQYTPGFFGKLGRWFSSIFSSSSWFANNDSPEKMAWSDISADIRHAVIPSFLSKGHVGVQRELELGSLSKKLNSAPKQNAVNPVVAAAQNNAANHNANPPANNEVTALYRGHKNKIDDLLSSNANGLRSLVEDANNVALTEEQQKYILQGPLAKTLVSSTPERAEQLLAADVCNQIDEFAIASYPEWPTQQIAADQLNNPVELKKYTDKLAACISHIFTHDRDKNHEEITQLMAKFMMPAIFSMYDVLTVKLDWTTPPNNFIGLELYRQLLVSLFKHPSLQFVAQPENNNDSDNIKFWKRLYQLHNQCLCHYDHAVKLYRKFNGESFSDIPANQGVLTAEGITLINGFKTSINNFNDITWQQLKLPVLNNKQGDLRGFYYEFAQLRYLLRKHLIDGQKQIIKELQKQDPISILNNNEIHCSAIVKLLATLNSFANQFNTETNKSNSTLAEFFGNGAAAAGTAVTEILQFINKNKDDILSVYIGDSKKELEDTLRSIFNLLRDMNNPHGMKFRETVNGANEMKSNSSTESKKQAGLLDGLLGWITPNSSSPSSSPDSKSTQAKKAAVDQSEEKKERSASVVVIDEDKRKLSPTASKPPGV